jgi:hypothetical protein
MAKSQNNDRIVSNLIIHDIRMWLQEKASRTPVPIAGAGKGMLAQQ